MPRAIVLSILTSALLLAVPRYSEGGQFTEISGTVDCYQGFLDPFGGCYKIGETKLRLIAGDGKVSFAVEYEARCAKKNSSSLETCKDWGIAEESSGILTLKIDDVAQIRGFLEKAGRWCRTAVEEGIEIAKDAGVISLYGDQRKIVVTFSSPKGGHCLIKLLYERQIHPGEPFDYGRAMVSGGSDGAIWSCQFTPEELEGAIKGLETAIAEATRIQKLFQ